MGCGPAGPQSSLLMVAVSAGAQELGDNPRADWPTYGGSFDHQRFSRLREVTPRNVAKLRVAWTFAIPDAGEPNSSIQTTPLVVRGQAAGLPALRRRHAGHLAAGTRDRAGRGTRNARVGVRSPAAIAAQGLLLEVEPRRRVRQRGAPGGRRRAARLRGHARRAPVGRVGGDRPAGGGLRGRRGPRGIGHGRRQRRGVQPQHGSSLHPAVGHPGRWARARPRPRRGRHLGRRIRDARVRDRVRRPHRRARVALLHRARARRCRRRHLAAAHGTLRRSPSPRRRGRMDDAGLRRGFRPLVLRGRQSRSQPRRDTSRRRQPVHRVGRGARRADRAARLALPAGAPRPLGLRSRQPAPALRGGGKAGGGPGGQDRLLLHPRSRDRCADLRVSGDAGAALRRRRARWNSRESLPHAARLRSGTSIRSAPAPRRADRSGLCGAADLHASQPHGNEGGARRLRRIGMVAGRLRSRGGARLHLRRRAAGDVHREARAAPAHGQIRVRRHADPRPARRLRHDHRDRRQHRDRPLAERDRAAAGRRRARHRERDRLLRRRRRRSAERWSPWTPAPAPSCSASRRRAASMPRRSRSWPAAASS